MTTVTNMHIYKNPSRKNCCQLLLSAHKMETMTTFSLLPLLFINLLIPTICAIEIRPQDFNNFVMPCYGGRSMSGIAQASSYSQQSSTPYNLRQTSGLSTLSRANDRVPYRAQALDQSQDERSSSPLLATSELASSRDGYNRGSNILGQDIPRGQTIENFISLATKIEAAFPRLNLDQLVKGLLNRFHYDNHYLDKAKQAHISRTKREKIVNFLFNPEGTQSLDTIPEHILDQSEKCSMYFMLSHFIEKIAPNTLAGSLITPLSGFQQGVKPPYLQAAGSNYPSRSANSAFSASGQRYSGPSPGYGSALTNTMNGFGSGVSNNPDNSANSNNPYGMNVPAQTNPFLNPQALNNRNSGQLNSMNKMNPLPVANGFGPNRDLNQAYEYGVVTVGYQENAAIVLNRVLMGILAGSPAIPRQTIKQLTDYAFQSETNANKLVTTAKLNDDIDPLFGATLADLWAISASKQDERGPNGDDGHWNDTLCPTNFKLDRANSIQFTTAELLGGIDGFNLGRLRRDMQRNMKLSDLLRFYYSKDGFKPHFSDYSVCSRNTVLNSPTTLEELRRQTENYLRLNLMDTPTPDIDIQRMVQQADSFKIALSRAAEQHVPNSICLEPETTYQQNQCEIPKADVAIIMDTSSQADEAYMSLVALKLARKLGISRHTGSLSLLTNQQDGGYLSFNPIIKNATNTAEIGCALVHDGTRSYQGGQTTDPIQLIKMFEQTLVNMDPNPRQYYNQPYSSSSTSSLSSNYRLPFITSLSEYSLDGTKTKNFDGAKAIIWFNYGNSIRQSPLLSYPQQTLNYGSNSNDFEYRLYEAKKNLRENYVGAAVLALGTNREDLKKIVFDEQRDIIEIPQSSSSGSEYNIYVDPYSRQDLDSPTDQTVEKLMNRLCDVPAEFQYPNCRRPSENERSFGYITPGRMQYWMMAPKTFFSSNTVKMTFRVEGGRLRICFGRMSRPDESFAKSGYSQAAIATNLPPGNVIASSSSSTNNYYTGLDAGECKDVTPNIEVEFVVDDPCWKTSVAECKPFYFVIKETSSPGEVIDQNWICKDDGCKRLDQAKFTITHTGVACSSAFKTVSSSFIVLALSTLLGLWSLDTNQAFARSLCSFRSNLTSKIFLPIIFVFIFSSISVLKTVEAQQAGVYDFGQARYGEKRGNFTPADVLGIVLIVMTILAGLAFTIGLCYYITKQDKKGMTRLEQQDF